PSAEGSVKTSTIEKGSTCGRLHPDGRSRPSGYDWTMSDTAAVVEAVHEALSHVNDPEIRRPITELGMVDAVEADGGRLRVKILLTIAACPLRDTLQNDVREAALGV